MSQLYNGISERLFYTLGKRPDTASPHDFYMALCYAVRDQMMTYWLDSKPKSKKEVAYLSAEFLIGPQLNRNLINLGILKEAEEALKEYGYCLDKVVAQAEEPGLGNGGLGRLAACYMESLSTLKVPATGYGIRYKYGIFKQIIRDNQQIEITDNWLHGDWPWELCQPEESVLVGFGGRVENYISDREHYRVRWVPDEQVVAVPYDVLQLGYRVNSCNRLRLWRADATETFDFYAFNIGDYLGSVEQSVTSETISKVLYPNDGTDQGKTLRLKQQFFFVSASLQDMLRSLEKRNIPLTEFPDYYAVQLNDTHPSIAVAELMRLLVDERHMEWEDAWEITHKTIAYTNHTLLPEALEKWSLKLFKNLLPRHMEIIYEINRRFLNLVRLQYPGNESILSKLSIIDETGNKFVRMAHLATVGSHHVNGVAELHSDLVKSQLMPEFNDLWPHKFTNVTNGVTPRRWIASCNPSLSEVLTEYCGPDWITDMGQLKKLEEEKSYELLEKLGEAKLLGKHHLACYIFNNLGISVDPSSMFDVHVKRIHEYKRQHLLALQVIAQYLRIKNGKDFVPRTVIFGGKAAPGYYMAKLIVHFINSIAETINSDPDMDGKLRVVFLPNYSVKLGELVYPAADLSEQISTAGKEASGTGNMKFQMNGALTIGTLDGANVEIRNLVGKENFFLFGKTESEIGELWRNNYDPKHYMSAELWEVINLIKGGHFSGGDKDTFRPLLDNLLNNDPFCVFADFDDYLNAQDAVNEVWKNRDEWNNMSLLNIARSGFFSSDRSIRDYCDKIWGISV
jgi:starch phosphorylase|tara:strand:- start:1428 stop:3812 length:2385 start_codon:yes stop_codon:yes gene_type:complete